MRRAWLALLLSLAAICAPARAGDEPTFVDWLKALGADASFDARERMFVERFPRDRYQGTSAQNLALWEALKAEAAAGTFPGTAVGSKPTASSTSAAPAPPRRAATRLCVREWVEADRWRVRVDPTRQVVELDAPRRVVYDEPRGEEDAPIVATLPESEGFVSAAMLLEKARAFEEGVYAAASVALQRGAGAFAGKAKLLESLRRRLESVSNEERGLPTAAPFAATRAAGTTVPVPPALLPLVEMVVRQFETTTAMSTPVGFSTWGDELRAAYRQDRLLEPVLPSGPPLAALVRALHDDPEARATYDRTLALVERLSNPLTAPDLRTLLVARDRGEPSPDTPAAFLPACRSDALDMEKRLMAVGVDPRGADVAAAFQSAVREGKLSLAAKADSGWRDRVRWATEPLLVPARAAENGRLRFTPAYRDHMAQLFGGTLSLVQETHVKALDADAGAARPSYVRIAPALSVEPLATVWLRRADTYRWVRSLLEAAFGHDGLAALRRWTPDGPVERPLDEELRAMETLFTGAYVRSCKEIGHPAGGLPFADESEAAFAAWAEDVAHDPDLSHDLRRLEPIAYDPRSGRLRARAFLGWTTKPVRATFVAPPDVTVTSTADGRPAEPTDVVLGIAATTVSAAYPNVADVWASSVPDRATFRGLCDAKKTRAAILAAIGTEK